MRKTILSILIILGALSSSIGQSHEKGDLLIGPGVGFGQYVLLGGYTQSITFLTNVDYGIHKHGSVGLYGGFYVSPGNFGPNVTSFHFGPRGNFHLLNFLEEKLEADLPTEKLDAYVTIWFGYNIRQRNLIPLANRFEAGGAFGARYYFAKSVAGFIELGANPTSLINIGATIKL